MDRIKYNDRKNEIILMSFRYFQLVIAGDKL